MSSVLTLMPVVAPTSRLLSMMPPVLPELASHRFRSAPAFPHIAIEAPNQPFVDGTSWRCADGKVKACFVGANLPCGEKADLSKSPGTGIVDYCKANPNAEIVPMVASGRATVYEWRCKSGAPEVVKQLVKADEQGFIAEIWYDIAK